MSQFQRAKLFSENFATKCASPTSSELVLRVIRNSVTGPGKPDLLAEVATCKPGNSNSASVDSGCEVNTATNSGNSAVSRETAGDLADLTGSLLQRNDSFNRAIEEGTPKLTRGKAVIDEEEYDSSSKEETLRPNVINVSRKQKITEWLEL